MSGEQLRNTCILSRKELHASGCNSYKDYQNCGVSCPNPIQCTACPSWEGMTYDRATDNSPPGTRGGETPTESARVRIERKKYDPSCGE